MANFVSILLCLIALFAEKKEFSVESNRHQRLVVDGEVDLYQKVANLEQEIEILKRSAGTTYIRWGRTTCPGNGTTRVYEGFMAGTSFGRSGSPTDYVCLPSDPTWDYYEDVSQNNILITGIEYDFRPYNTTKYFGANIKGAEAPCAVCQTPRSSVLMTPGRKDCYSGWTNEYNGYLVSGYPDYHDSCEYVCLDRRPESVPHSGHFDDENMLYLVEGKCGQNLACPPYVDGRELACVVCSL